MFTVVGAFCWVELTTRLLTIVQLLCSFANKLDASVKFNYNKKARPNTSFARSNVTKFLDAMVRMGVSAEVKFPALNLQKMKDVE